MKLTGWTGSQETCDCFVDMFKIRDMLPAWFVAKLCCANILWFTLHVIKMY